MPNRTHLFLAILSASALACQTLTLPLTPATPTVAPTATLNSALSHFDSEWLAFDYPNDMQLYTGSDAAFAWYPDIDFGGDQIVALGDSRFYFFEKYFRWFRITRRPFLVEQDVATTVQQMYVPLEDKYSHPGSLLDAPVAVAISGTSAYEKRYKIWSGEPAYDMRDIWVVKAPALYVISTCTEWTNPDDVAAFDARVDAMLEGLVLK
jgi:hypothetical protein